MPLYPFFSTLKRNQSTVNVEVLAGIGTPIQIVGMVPRSYGSLVIPFLSLCCPLFYFRLAHIASGNEYWPRQEDLNLISTGVAKASTLFTGSSSESSANNKQPDSTIQGTKDDGRNSMSACLLTMDDLHRLDEWIAYHWYTMPLRYLVVAVDPHSRTTPTPLLDKWRPWLTELVEWTDSDFTNRDFIISVKDTPDKKKAKHRQRQQDFYVQCTRHLMAANRSWTSYHDSDEFISLNGDFLVTNDYNALAQQPGSTLKVIHRYSTNEISTNTFTSGSSYQRQAWVKHFSQPCVGIPRGLYSAAESSIEEQQRGIPEGFATVNASSLVTLRYRYRYKAPRRKYNGLGKSLIDVTQISEDQLKPYSAHRPLEMCKPTKGISYTLPIGIHHYLGSWESYSSREDARIDSGLVSYGHWINKGLKKGGGADDEIRPWLRGFTKEVGLPAANELLRSAGTIPRELLLKNTGTMKTKLGKYTGDEEDDEDDELVASSSINE